MSAWSFISIGIGAAFGAWLRWLLGLWLNPLLPALPLGTLAANLIGGYFMGIAMAWLLPHPALPAELRLALITGFLGALTTFSAFSAEAVTLIGRGAWLWLAAHVGAHLAGTLGMTALGIASVQHLQGQ
jgi:CrcB protein